ncbi:hypothetical protein [Halochromatium glycolicum]|uniref:hypothetical protein n=1 Tax=Halochromatium glycolicum TaxID=85075 RepID=UPI00190A94DC|nr:hypothetical protein [Halochromatium glycolicum]
MSCPRPLASLLSGILLLALLCAVPPAAAHKVILSAWPLGNAIEGEVGFSSGEVAEPGTRIEVFGPDGERLGETTIDDDGLFRYRPTSAVPHTLRANLGAGHVAETRLSVDELPAIATPDPTPTAAGNRAAIEASADGPPMSQQDALATPTNDGNARAETSPADVAQTGTTAARDASGAASGTANATATPTERVTVPTALSDPNALRTLIARTVQHEIRPLRRELTRLRESQRLHEIIGGLGYIAGLFGVLFFVYAHRERRNQPGT